ncbi:MAG: exodeoxyribonuclease V subunit gamma [Buchnera aphidicola (Meitanaphis elongallis)]
MLTLYKSHNFHALIEKACSIFTTIPLSNPLQSEIFITPNEVIDHWIKIFISQKHSIMSNITFLRFNKFIWKIFKHMNTNYNSKLELKKYHLMWTMMNIKNIKSLTSFIHTSSSQTQLFEIVSYLSKNFKEYLLYRPDLIKKWEKPSQSLTGIHSLYHNEYALLWKTLIKYIKTKNKSIWNYADLLFFIYKNIKKSKININKFPSRIFLFGNNYLTPSNVIILKKISKLCKIYVFYVTPYRNGKEILLNEIKLKKRILTIIKNRISCFFKATTYYKEPIERFLDKQKHAENVLLWGKYGFEHTLLLNLINIKEINLFNIMKPTYLLQKIQKNIIYANINSNNKKDIKKNNKNIIYANDKSISIHVCTTLKREIEVLHNNILNILNNDHDILFHDILIISKNINLYIPFIHSIFNPINVKHRIPFYIVSKSYENQKNILKIIEKILNLPNNLLNNKNIFNFLESSYILKKFNIQEKEIIVLFKIIQQFHIELGTERTAIKHTLPKSNKKYILSHGEKRIFLGKAINDENYTIWNKIVPCAHLDEKHYEMFSKLTTFVLLLHKWKQKLSISKTLKSWKSMFKHILNDFFEKNTVEEKEITFIQNQWNKIIDPGIKENYKKKIPIKLLKNELLKNVSKKINVYNLFSGKVTFCNGFILRSIPFKTICILGMNETFTLQKKNTDNFNLIYKNPRICDPHKKNKYEYLFLETLLSAQKILLISYQKESEKYNKINEPSSLINQLFSYIYKNFYIFNKNKKEQKNNKHELFSHLYYFHENESYNVNNFIKKSNYYNFNTTWSKIFKLKKIYKNHFTNTLQKIEYKDINISELISFWKNPIQYFFNKRLHIKLNAIKTKNLNQENFLITKLDNYIINNNIINVLLKQKNISQLFSYYQYKGIIPHGNLGEIYWKNQLSIIKPLYNKINLIKTKLKDEMFYLKINEYILRGTLKNINHTGLLRWTPTIIKNKDIISLWLEHLIYCSIYKTGNSTILGLNNKHLNFMRLHKKRAIYFLKKYIDGYSKGMNKLLLLTNSGIDWINTIYDKKNKTISTDKTCFKKSIKNMLTTWEGNNWKKGEKNDLYIKKIITILSKEEISKMCKIAEKWILPILKHIQNNR